MANIVQYGKHEGPSDVFFVVKGKDIYRVHHFCGGSVVKKVRKVSKNAVKQKRVDGLAFVQRCIQSMKPKNLGLNGWYLVDYSMKLK